MDTQINSLNLIVIAIRLKMDTYIYYSLSDLVVIAVRLKWIHKLLSKCNSDSSKIENGYIYYSPDLVVIAIRLKMDTYIAL